jgi:hypothetical protein
LVGIWPAISPLERIFIRQTPTGATCGVTMATHRFHIGQSVGYRPASRSQDAPRGAYKISARLPQADDGQFEYRIKHSGEAHERIAKESELSIL